MKISKKLIVSALSTGMGVSLVGAITGTVAWYQYSTRSTVSFVGTSVGASENLLVSLNANSGFKNDLNHTEIATALGDTTLAPITTGNIAKGDALPANFKAQPIYQKFDYSEWINADASSYVQFTVYLRLNKMNNQGQEVPVEDERTVYLTGLVIQDDANNTKSDISDAIRVHLHSEREDMLLSKKGETINVHGKLDLNRDTKLDTDQPAYSFIDYDPNDAIDYGAGTQEAYKLDGVKPTETDGQLSGSHYFGTFNSAQLVVFEENQDFENGVDYYEDALMENETADEHAVAGKNYYIHREVIAVTVTIWLEGWQELLVEGESKSVTPANGTNLGEGDYYTDVALTEHATGAADGIASYYTHKYDSMWDVSDYIDSMFDVGLMFEVNANI